MKKYEIIITAKNGEEVLGERKAVNIRTMWKEVTEQFKETPDAYLHITKDGEKFMKLHRIKTASGKYWCKNDIKESRRKSKNQKETPVENAIAEPTPEPETAEKAEEPADETTETPVEEEVPEEKNEINLDDFKVPTIEEINNIAADN